MNKSKLGTPARKLNSLSVEQKDEIIRYKKSHPHMTQAAIALLFEKEWNFQFKLTKSTMSYILYYSHVMLASSLHLKFDIELK